MIDSREWLLNELKKVEDWEKSQSDLWFWEKLGRLPFKLIDKWTPDFIQNKIGILLDELGQYIQTGGSYLSTVSKIPTYYPDLAIETLADVKELPISTMDSAVEKISGNRKKLATVQGATTGIGGVKSFHFTRKSDFQFLHVLVFTLTWLLTFLLSSPLK